MNEEQLDRIDSYVLHKMDDAEVTAFEEEMSADESLANEVRDTEMIVEALAERERKKQSLEQFKSSYPLYKKKVEQLEAEHFSDERILKFLRINAEQLKSLREMPQEKRAAVMAD